MCHPQTAKDGTNFGDKRRSLGRYSWLVDSSDGVFFTTKRVGWRRVCLPLMFVGIPSVRWVDILAYVHLSLTNKTSYALLHVDIRAVEVLWSRWPVTRKFTSSPATTMLLLVLPPLSRCPVRLGVHARSYFERLDGQQARQLISKDTTLITPVSCPSKRMIQWAHCQLYQAIR
jgi:hypothetical protein